MMCKRGMFESRSAVLTLGMIALLVAPAGAVAQQRRTVVIKEPTGWFGVRISDQAMLDERGTAFFDSYPVVTHVDSGSPAARAGVQPGDQLLTFNAHDMRGGSVELAKWLRVGAPFVLKIRRNDVTQVLRGRLDRRPDDWDQKMIVELTVPEGFDQRSSSISRPRAQPMGMMRVRQRMPTPEPLPLVLTPTLGYGGGVYPFAGAEFIPLNTDLCDVLGVKPEGVLVTNVVEGSAARNAGLRGGDIILRADSVRVGNPIDLVRAIRSADESDHTMVLQIMRKHRLQALTLRWGS
ncbi:MAG TPA: PDZ domain-containing protein [Gemmatimonadaceae bacterium]|nr:PDZ domain-containing protein [Gemmatimonadaceae bacterium]